MLFGLKNLKQSAVAAGWPATAIVVGRVQKGSGALYLANGSNLYRIAAPDRYERFAAQAGESGSFQLTGYQGGVATCLAQFGSAKAASNALQQVSTVHARLGGRRWGRLAAGLVFSMLLVRFFVAGQGVAVAGAETSLPQQPMTTSAPGQASLRFNPQEQSLEEIERLAAGGKYEFKREIKAPDIQPPVLSCANN